MSDTMSDMGALSRLRADAIGDHSRYCELIAKVSMMLEMLKQQAALGRAERSKDARGSAPTHIAELTVSQPIPTRHPVAPGPARKRKGKRARWEKAR